MTDEPLTCVICHEAMEPYHEVVKPTKCDHTFHAICINIWLANYRNCPLCRRRISLATQMPWRTLFKTALLISTEMAIERAAYTYNFLSLMLRRFTTAAQWDEARDIIIIASEKFEIGTIKLPFLDLSNRTVAKREKKKWGKLFKDVSGETIYSERIKSSRRWILDKLSFMFIE